MTGSPRGRLPSRRAHVFVLALSALTLVGCDERLARALAIVAIVAIAILAVVGLLEIAIVVASFAFLASKEPSRAAKIALPLAIALVCGGHLASVVRILDVPPHGSMNGFDAWIVRALVVASLPPALVVAAFIGRAAKLARGPRVAGGTTLAVVAAGAVHLVTSRALAPWDDTPVLVRGRVVFAARSETHGCILTSEGDVGCFGDNVGGSLGGRRGVYRRAVPSRIPAIAHASGIAVTSSQTCVLVTDHVICFGEPFAGSATPAAAENAADAPGVVIVGGGATAIDAADDRILVVEKARVRIFSQRQPPVDVPLPTGALEVAAGEFFVCARSDGAVTCVDPRRPDAAIVIRVPSATKLVASRGAICLTTNDGLACLSPMRAADDRRHERVTQVGRCALKQELARKRHEARLTPDPRLAREIAACEALRTSPPETSFDLSELVGTTHLALDGSPTALGAGGDVVCIGVRSCPSDAPSCVGAGAKIGCADAWSGAPTTLSAWLDVHAPVDGLAVGTHGLCAVSEGQILCTHVRSLRAWLRGEERAPTLAPLPTTP